MRSPGDPPPRRSGHSWPCSRGDSAAARRTLAEPDSLGTQVHVHRSTAVRSRPRRTTSWATTRPLSVLTGFEPAALQTGGFDSRWGMLGRVRLLRGAAYESWAGGPRPGPEYRQVLSPVEEGRPGAAALRPAGAARAGAGGEWGSSYGYGLFAGDAGLDRTELQPAAIANSQ